MHRDRWNIWERYIGSQTPQEFMSYADSRNIAKEVGRYVRTLPKTFEFQWKTNKESRSYVTECLIQCIEEELGENLEKWENKPSLPKRNFVSTKNRKVGEQWTRVGRDGRTFTLEKVKPFGDGKQLSVKIVNTKAKKK